MHYTLADFVTDIAQNGIESGTDLLELHVREVLHSDEVLHNSEAGDFSGKGEFHFSVKDKGKGMVDAELRQVRNPFVNDGLKHPHRKVGLGLPFLIQTAEISGGGWELESDSSGTTISAWFDMDNVDTPPIGDVPGMIRTVLLFNGVEDVVVQRTVDGRTYQVKKTELIDALGNLEDAQSLILLDKYLRELESNF